MSRSGLLNGGNSRGDGVGRQSIHPSAADVASQLRIRCGPGIAC